MVVFSHEDELEILTFFALLVRDSAAFDQTNTFYYVSATGNDSNVGTQAASWRTFNMRRTLRVRALRTCGVESTKNWSVSMYPATRVTEPLPSKAIPAKRRSSTRRILPLLEDKAHLPFTIGVIQGSEMLEFATSTLPSI